MDHWCRVEEIEHLPFELQKNIAIPLNEDGEYEKCRYYPIDHTNLTNWDYLNWRRYVDASRGFPAESSWSLFIWILWVYPLQGWTMQCEQLLATVTFECLCWPCLILLAVAKHCCSFLGIFRRNNFVYQFSKKNFVTSEKQDRFSPTSYASWVTLFTDY